MFFDSHFSLQRIGRNQSGLNPAFIHLPDATEPGGMHYTQIDNLLLDATYWP
jgi:hypothetical protein